MSSNGLAASRWADADIVAARIETPAVVCQWVGLATSQWADQGNQRVPNHDSDVSISSLDTSNTSSMDDEDEDFEEDSDETDETGEEEDPAVTMWRSWVHQSLDRIPPSEIDSYFQNPTLLFNLTPLPQPLINNMKTAVCKIIGWIASVDRILHAEMEEYINSFSPPARKILDDQLATYMGRIWEDREETGTPYNGKYAREMSAWAERLRHKDMNGDFDDFAEGGLNNRGFERGTAEIQRGFL